MLATHNVLGDALHVSGHGFAYTIFLAVYLGLIRVGCTGLVALIKSSTYFKSF